MQNTPDNLLPDSWHKYFAIQANNTAWTLSESLADISLNTEILDTAHASAWHWRVVGKEINHMRSVMLLALVHARMNMGPSAWAYAERMRMYFTEKADTPDWELAFTHTVHALAALAFGKTPEFKASRQAAFQSLQKIQDKADREVVMKTFQLIPQD
ncbi:hypothetical protein [Limnohabitans sp. Hippo4]|jgi:hypothetical protein|uniref:hypothetical protein n=1 Tax=Limnohabitans sp. Hippo4 TaxID=1826167 RepID=UPI000D374F2C|nr:hypothetical protein [Limnohabitans sp. Hippo4]MDE3233916.1 hypothetical protein [Pseudomonadota bacterium]PUE35272.1 hypothetical protein B9Z46_09380 [Limnohabitans sp. Hippo4]